MTNRKDLTSWKQLESLALQKPLQLEGLFQADDQRFQNFSINACGVLFDYSKQLLSNEVREKLLSLAEECDVASWREAMFSGEVINKTENRAVLHTALRSSFAGDDASQQEVSAELEHVRVFSEAIRSGEKKGWTGQVFTDVVCIGVGGSNLGPQMVTDALSGVDSGSLRLHYISSVDAVPLVNLLASLNAERTLFVISSKTFTTSETVLNANTARRWFLQCASEEAVDVHFVAVTDSIAKAGTFGIAEENCFKMWDWVGGRFSLWSAIGLPIALYAGFDVFRELLDGASAMDQHFLDAPLSENMPVMMALVGVWNATFLNMDTLAVLPYDQNLHKLPAYLQQAEMESNGKSVNWNGEAVEYPTCPIVWGQTGINGQHAFYQLLHQGTHRVPADFIGSVHSHSDAAEHHETLLANFFAQPRALMNGVSLNEVERDLAIKGLDPLQVSELARHKVHSGNRPSSSILIDRLDAFHLGALIALYEHKIFTQGILWQVYSFDQWGVELGKVLASNVLTSVLSDAEVSDYDDSTNGLINYYKAHR
ncbi:glucosephosphate isomerase [marine gamma proteobacterium HTCC2143]|uniref:Glucose-6-phosphate isomerase n=1 Tax=marine gamma proteobacterium HTCC2143 TaxID=247633 RepID=A0Y8U0_9GAMM|nr:glucosephosphate isomerase [marine gamma proteobacterium HTCC2143]